MRRHGHMWNEGGQKSFEDVRKKYARGFEEMEAEKQSVKAVGKFMKADKKMMSRDECVLSIDGAIM